MKTSLFIVALLAIFAATCCAENVVVGEKDGNVYVRYYVNQEDVEAGDGEQVIDSSKLPSREYRDAWEISGKKVVIDNSKKKEIEDSALVKEETKKLARKEAIKKLKEEGKISPDYKDKE